MATRLMLICASLAIGCTQPVERLIRLGQEYENTEEYFKAIEVYQLAVEKMDIETESSHRELFLLATERIAEINTYQLTNPGAGLYWLKKRREYLLSSEDLLKNQQKIIRLHMDFLGDYNQAVVEAQSLLGYELMIDDKCKIILDLSLALFNLNRQDEAMQEVSQCLGNIPLQKALAFKLASLEIDILMAKKRHQEAIFRIESLRDTFNELDVEQSIKLTHALALEEIKDFQSAKKILNDLLTGPSYSDKGYIKLRIERLKQKETQQAGARLRKPK